MIDASVALKWFLKEEGTEEALRILDELTSFIAPDLIFREMHAVLTKRVRMNYLDLDEAIAINETDAGRLPCKHPLRIRIDAFAFELASTIPITLYDACYLALAIEFGTLLYTSDRKLVNGLKNTPFESVSRLIR
ncbi:MAG: type II toxin-antitoxin system VapC family toxin [Balneolaceae bacterium]|nr:type II toxin-antitoxin system VapC family toxin [Balneolaceae bacterium]